MRDRYAVVGNPVAHSKSPLIHAAFAQQTGQDVEYGRVLAPLDAFHDAVLQFRSAGGRGMNVTLPFKLEAFALAGVRTPRALAAQAVNTLKFEPDAIVGDNTDGVGLLRDIEVNLACPLHGRRILLMGAGGAAQGVLAPLLEARPAQITIVNRSPDKAYRLAQRMDGRTGDARVSAAGYDALPGLEFDVIVNATSASLQDAVPELPAGIFAHGALAYDMMYGRALTPFLQRAQAQGVWRLADGLGMLVEQAAESFFVWRGVRPDTGPVIEQLRQQ
jgi:shikimate dehydrogenase